MSEILEITVEQFQESYRPDYKIASGGSGVVVKGYHKRLQKDVVIKKLFDYTTAESQQRAEADILKNLRHAYLPQVYDIFIMQGSCYTVMDFIAGKSFRQYLDEGYKFSDEQMVKYFTQLCEVVKYLHDQKLPVIHGDIKPDNIILTPNDDICLIDFNISSIAVNGVAYTRGYTKGYSAPEQEVMFHQLNGTGGAIPINKQSDVYSIGATMYHIYTGVKISESNSARVSANRSDSLIKVINKSLSANPAQRYKDAGEMYDALIRVYSNDSSIKAAGVIYGVLRFVFALLVVVGILVMVYGYMSLDGERDERYYGYIDEMEDAREAGDEDELLKYYKLAIKMRPENAQAYYQVAAFYYDTGDYFRTIDYIHDDIPEDSRLEEDDYIAGIYDIYAECFFECEQYDDACDAWETAINYNDEVSNYYRNLAVAYTLCGDTDEAQDILDKAYEYGITDDGTLLISGEIKNNIGDYAGALEDFEDCIEITRDDRTMYLAYVGSSNAINFQLNDATDKNILYDQNITLLTSASQNVSEQYRLSVLKRLADVARIAYLDNQMNDLYANTYLNHALNAYAQIEATGWMNEVEYYNYIDLYIKVREFDSALQIQSQMDNAYTDSLLAAESHAFLERQIQINKPDAERDYTMFCQYYEDAVRIANGATDERLNRLTEIYNEVH